MKQLATFALFFSVVLAPVAIGGVHTVTAVALLVIVLASYLTAQERRSRMPIGLGLFLALMAGAALVQMIPVPAGIHSVFAPLRANWLATLPEPLAGANPGPWEWVPLSFDPAATADRCMRWLVLGLVAALTRRRASKNEQTFSELLIAVCAIGLFEVAAGSIQTLSGSSRILGVYAPEANTSVWGTFVNSNHMAMFYGLAALSATHLAAKWYRDFQRWTVAAAVGASVFALLTYSHESLGVSVLFSVSWTALIAVHWRYLSRRRRPSSNFRRLASVGLTAACVVAVAGLFWPSGIKRALEMMRLDWLHQRMGLRLDLIETAVTAGVQSPAFGVGPGAGGDVLSAYFDWRGHYPVRINMVECDPVEWFLEYGAPIAVVAIGLLSYFVWSLGRQFVETGRSSAAFRFIVACYFVACSFFYFPFFTLGLSVPAVAIMSAVRKKGTVFGSAHWRWVAIAIAVTACAGSSYYRSWNEAPTGKGALSNRFVERQVRLFPADESTLMALARKAMERDQTRLAVGLARQARKAAPHAVTHLLFARAVARTNRLGATVRAFERLFERFPDRVRREWIDRYLFESISAPEDLADAVRGGTDAHWRHIFERLEEQLGLPGALAFAHRLVDLEPDRTTGWRLVFDAYLEQGKTFLAEQWARAATRRLRRESDRLRGLDLVIRALRRQDREQEAIRLAIQKTQAGDMTRRLARQIFALRDDDPDNAEPDQRRIVRKAFEAYCTHSAVDWPDFRCLEVRGWLAEVRGDLGEARSSYTAIWKQLRRVEPLARFFARRGQCRQLEEVFSDWTARAKSPNKIPGRLKNIRRRCVEQRNQ